MGPKQQIVDLFAKLRKRLPGLVLRTSLICGLPGEGEAEFEELCEFLRGAAHRARRCVPVSPPRRAPGQRRCRIRWIQRLLERRVELVVDLQSRIMDEYEREPPG